MEIPVYDAKAKFSEVIRRVTEGEAFVVTRNGKRVAEIIPCRKRGTRKRGCLKEYIGAMSDDFNAPLDDFSEYQ